MENFKILLEKYKANMNHQNELDELLLNEQGKDKWIACLQNRAEQMHRMYAENEDLLSELDAFLSHPLTPDMADILYLEAHQMYWDDYDDCQILLPILYKLIDYYEITRDIDKLVFLYSAAYYEESEVQNRRIGHKEPCTHYNLKIIRYGSQYTSISDEKTRARIWAAYYNIIVVALGNKAIDIDTSYKYLNEALALWNSPEIQALDGKNEKMLRIIVRIRREWLVAEEFIDTSKPETKAAFCKEADNAFRKEMQKKGRIYDVTSEVYAAYLHSQAIQKKATYEYIVDEYLDYCKTKFQTSPETNDLSAEDSYFIINAPLTLVRWLSYGIPPKKCKEIVHTLKEMTQDTWHQKLDVYSTPFVNELMAEWCSKLIKYLDEQDEKEEWLFRLLIRRQLPTYLHTVMVQHLARPILEETLQSNPELFESLPEVASKDLLKYVTQCALLHDIGKTKITDIVNTQNRHLYDKEFSSIRLHPQYGAEMIANDKDLSKYHDVILGHHKFYDGNGGYPEDFNNTASPYRIIIDLITICDCIDAATDHLGRNYKSAKTLNQVLEELNAQKGTRYNPNLVDVIINSPQLQDKMRHIVSDGRLDIMYHAYSNRVI